MPTLTTTQRRERFERLVREAEQAMERSPARYRARLALLAALGYAVIFGTMVVLVALVLGSVWASIASTALLLLLIKKKIIFVLAVAVWVLARALWIRFDRPVGVRLTRAEAPALFETVDALRSRLDLPRIHDVMLTAEFNAAVVQTPRLGLFGWQRNAIVLGIQLLLALSPEEARAVLAHELGHLSRSHSRFNGWIYRVRTTWYRVMAAFDEAEGFGAGILRRFFDWYSPYFSASSFALARGNEYEADAIAAALTSPRTTASALVGTATREQLAGEGYWGPLFERAAEDPEPERAPFTGLHRFHASAPHAGDAAAKYLDAALAEQTGVDDTHPSLADRLAAIGVPPDADTMRDGPSAAEIWLGGALGEILERFDAEWLACNAEPWAAHHEDSRESRERYAALLDRLDDLESLELWELGRLAEDHATSEQALALSRAYQARVPEDPDGDFAVGQALLAAGDPEGVEHMRRAMRRFSLAMPACEQLIAYFARAGDTDSAEHWRLRAEAQMDAIERAQAERAALSPKDRYLSSGLDESALAYLRGQLETERKVRSAWIARKAVDEAPESPLYVLAYRPRGLVLSVGRIGQRLADELDLPGECFVVARAGDTRAIAKAVERHGDRVI